MPRSSYRQESNTSNPKLAPYRLWKETSHKSLASPPSRGDKESCQSGGLEGKDGSDTGFMLEGGTTPAGEGPGYCGSPWSPSGGRPPHRAGTPSADLAAISLAPSGSGLDRGTRFFPGGSEFSPRWPLGPPVQPPRAGHTFLHDF